MDGLSILSSLNQMCRDIDAGRPLRRINLGRAIAPVIIGFSLAAGGCPGRDESVNLYGAVVPPPAAEVCDDGIDNDGDGRVDCSDSDCREAGECGAVGVYGAPPMPPPVAEICNDGIDNDLDGRVDCDDDECASQGACVPNPLYGAPPPGSGTAQ